MQSRFYQDMNIISVFRLIVYVKIYFVQTRLCIVTVVNLRCEVSNAIFQRVENWSGMKTAPVTISQVAMLELVRWR